MHATKQLTSKFQTLEMRKKGNFLVTVSDTTIIKMGLILEILQLIMLLNTNLATLASRIQVRLKNAIQCLM